MARYKLSDAPQEEFPQALFSVGSEDDQICAPVAGSVKNSSSNLFLCDKRICLEPCSSHTFRGACDHLFGLLQPTPGVSLPFPGRSLVPFEEEWRIREVLRPVKPVLPRLRHETVRRQIALPLLKISNHRLPAESS